MPNVDLHIHTYFSDGTLSPEEVVRQAKEKGFSAIAISDHDSVDGISRAKKEAKRLGLEIIPAVELTVEAENSEIHILGYFINYRDKNFRNFLKELRQDRRARIIKIISKLKGLGFDIKVKDVLKVAGPGSLGRLHVAFSLKKKGYVRNVYEAFNNYLGEGKPAYVRRKRLAPQHALKWIKKLGGVSVLAHPHTIKNKKLLEDLLKLDFQGIEVYHSDHSPRDSRHFRKMAKKKNLIITGGSDCHGFGKEKILLGNVKIPYAVVKELKKLTR